MEAWLRVAPFPYDAPKQAAIANVRHALREHALPAAPSCFDVTAAYDALETPSALRLAAQKEQLFIDLLLQSSGITPSVAYPPENQRQSEAFVTSLFATLEAKRTLFTAEEWRKEQFKAVAILYYLLLDAQAEVSDAFLASLFDDQRDKFGKSAQCSPALAAATKTALHCDDPEELKSVLLMVELYQALDKLDFDVSFAFSIVHRSDDSRLVLMRCHQFDHDRLALAIYRRVLPIFHHPVHLMLVLQIHLRAERVPITTCLRFVRDKACLFSPVKPDDFFKALVTYLCEAKAHPNVLVKYQELLSGATDLLPFEEHVVVETCQGASVTFNEFLVLHLVAQYKYSDAILEAEKFKTAHPAAVGRVHTVLLPQLWSALPAAEQMLLRLIIAETIKKSAKSIPRELHEEQEHRFAPIRHVLRPLSASRFITQQQAGEMTSLMMARALVSHRFSPEEENAETEEAHIAMPHSYRPRRATASLAHQEDDSTQNVYFVARTLTEKEESLLAELQKQSRSPTASPAKVVATPKTPRVAIDRQKPSAFAAGLASPNVAAPGGLTVDKARSRSHSPAAQEADQPVLRHRTASPAKNREEDTLGMHVRHATRSTKIASAPKVAVTEAMDTSDEPISAVQEEEMDKTQEEDEEMENVTPRAATLSPKRQSPRLRSISPSAQSVPTTSSPKLASSNVAPSNGASPAKIALIEQPDMSVEVEKEEEDQEEDQEEKEEEEEEKEARQERRVSPRRSASPQKTLASPQKTIASPQRSIASPQRTMASPKQQSVASPQKSAASARETSPEKKDPSQQDASPHATSADDPRAETASPQKQSPSPRVSPRKSIASPAKSVTSPSKTLAVPDTVSLDLPSVPSIVHATSIQEAAEAISARTSPAPAISADWEMLSPNVFEEEATSAQLKVDSVMDDGMVSPNVLSTVPSPHPDATADETGSEEAQGEEEGEEDEAESEDEGVGQVEGMRTPSQETRSPASSAGSAEKRKVRRFQRGVSPEDLRDFRPDFDIDDFIDFEPTSVAVRLDAKNLADAPTPRSPRRVARASASPQRASASPKTVVSSLSPQQASASRSPSHRVSTSPSRGEAEASMDRPRVSPERPLAEEVTSPTRRRHRFQTPTDGEEETLLSAPRRTTVISNRSAMHMASSPPKEKGSPHVATPLRQSKAVSVEVPPSPKTTVHSGTAPRLPTASPFRPSLAPSHAPIGASSSSIQKAALALTSPPKRTRRHTRRTEEVSTSASLAKLASLLPTDPTSHKLPSLAESNIPVPKKKASSLHAFEDAPEMKDTTPFTGADRPRLATPKLTKRSSRIKPRKGSPGGYDTADEMDEETASPLKKQKVVIVTPVAPVMTPQKKQRAMRQLQQQTPKASLSTPTRVGRARNTPMKRGTPYRHQIEGDDGTPLPVPQELEIGGTFGQEVETMEQIHTETPLTRSTLRQMKAGELAATPTRTATPSRRGKKKL